MPASSDARLTVTADFHDPRHEGRARSCRNRPVPRLGRLFERTGDTDVTIALSIHASSTQFFMSTTQVMPRVELKAVVTGLPATTKLDFTWRVQFDYSHFLQVPGARRRNVRTKSHPPMPALKGNPVVVPFTTAMCGQLTVTVEVMIDGKLVKATRDDILIGGTNPSAAELRRVVGSSVVRKLIQQESGGQQFSDTGTRRWQATAINPNWSGDNLRGVGLGQLTNDPPTDDDIWNWRSNATDLGRRFVAKRHSAAKLHTRIAASSRFQDEVKALNAWRALEGLAALKPVLPPLTSAQQDAEGLRAYNGFGIKVAGQYLDYVHEFEPARVVLVSAKRKDAAGQPVKSALLLDVDTAGHAKWTQISGAERERRYNSSHKIGEPNYVAMVLAQAD